MTRGQTLAVVLVGSAGIGVGGYYLYQKVKAPGGLAGASAVSGGRANASGGTVSLTLSASHGVVGQPVQLVAQAANISNPVYQFWWKTPSGHWHQTGSYSFAHVYELVPEESGTYEVVVYARSAAAPTHETSAQRVVYEALSAPAFESVS